MTTTSTPPNRATETAIDPSDERLLYHSDHPNCALASKALDGDNHGHWRRGVKVSLLSKNKLGFVNEKTEAPASDATRLAQWKRTDPQDTKIAQTIESELYHLRDQNGSLGDQNGIEKSLSNSTVALSI
ncbi:hypothetical protein AKJ16_DCAP11298 [Drosera capensis]